MTQPVDARARPRAGCPGAGRQTVAGAPDRRGAGLVAAAPAGRASALPAGLAHPPHREAR